MLRFYFGPLAPGMLGVILASAAVAQAHAQEARWSALELPSLCRPNASPPHAPVLADGRHLILGTALAADVDESGAPLPVPLLLQMLEGEARASDLDAELYRGAPPLLARGSDAALALLRERVAELQRAGRALDIELVVGFETAAADGTGRTQTYRARTRSGEPAFFGERTSTAFVAGWDVEVAPDAGVASPLVGSALIGHTLHLWPSRVDGGVHIDGVLDLADLTSIETYDLDTVDLGVVQRPRVESLQVVFAGHVAPGERLQVQLEGSALEHPSWTVWIEARAADVTDETTDDGSGGWALVDLSFVARPVLALPPARAGAGVDDWFDPPHGSSFFEPLPPSAVAAAVDAARLRSTERGLRAPLYWTNTHVFVPLGDAAALDEAFGLVRAAQAARLDSWQVEVRRGGLRASFPVTIGRPARLLAGAERTWLVDYSVEIAPETWMPAPEVRATFDGLALDLLADSSGIALSGWIAGSEAPNELGSEEVQLGRLQLPVRRFRGATAYLRNDDEGLTLLEGELREGGPDGLEVRCAPRRP